MFGRRHDPGHGQTEGESKVDEIAEQQVASDRTIERVNKLATARVLSAEDDRLRQAVRGTARGIRAARRTGG
jgi:hypothetical protein